VDAGRGLTVADRESLERDGYLLVPSLLDEAALERLRSRLGELVRETVAAWGANPEQNIAEPGVVRMQLRADDSDFAPFHEHPLLADGSYGGARARLARVRPAATGAAARLRPPGAAPRL
jgi:hypothetical protein